MRRLMLIFIVHWTMTWMEAVPCPNVVATSDTFTGDRFESVVPPQAACQVKREMRVRYAFKDREEWERFYHHCPLTVCSEWEFDQ